MEQYGFEPFFPKQVVAEVGALDEGRLLDEGRPGIRDYRTLLWSSIDNDDTMDLDQLEYCERLPGGVINVKVAIADVDSCVPKTSLTDLHAAKNGTSVYTGVETFPMLPDRLSTNLTSLAAGRDRPAIVAEFGVHPDGSISDGSVCRALVQNKAKLVYETIGDWFEGKSGVPQSVMNTAGLEEQLRLQDEAARRLRDFRMEQGALELDTIEARTVAHGGEVSDLVVVRKNQARYIIENFMIAANVTMMGFLEKAKVPAIQRIVRTPKNWEGIIEAAAAFNETLPRQPSQKALSQFLIRRKEADPERFPDLSLAIVKLLGPGEYVMLEPGIKGLGHFGLAVADYTHATAPNRRYVDLILQRLVKSVLDGKMSPYDRKELTDLSSWCTGRDKASQKVERLMRKAAAAVLLAGRVGDSFDAIITGSSNKGTYARIISPPVEGRVIRGGEGAGVGRKVRVRLVNMDPQKGYIDFEMTAGQAKKR
ncbi:MAG: RNB domain-containing ribonuclease [Candidatus Altiarchaeota archaeon]|nr:RNB domain-containing ribonuclease [Candidatus Altiarchaeota archaeon]